MSLALRVPIFKSFQKNGATGEALKQNFSTFYYNKIGNFCLRVPPEAPFYWKLLKICIQNAKDMRKDVPILQV